MFFIFITLTLSTCGVTKSIASEKMSSAYIRQEVGVYGPISCGMSFVQFRVETAQAMLKRIAEQKREQLFSTPDDRPYPLEQLYIDDLISLRDLLNVDDDANKDHWDREIRNEAAAAYERIRSEGRLR